MTTDTSGDAVPVSHVYRSFLTIAIHGDRLYGVGLETGELYPLYVYEPLQDAIDARKTPPFSSSWPPYANKFMEKYVPLPIIFSDAGDLLAAHLTEASVLEELATFLPQLFLPTALRGQIGFQSRDDDSKYPWAQTTYKFRPLYYVKPGLFVDEHKDHPMMYVPATLQLEALLKPDVQQGVGPVTFPPPAIGP